MDVDAFIRDGYVAVRGAVDQETVTACRELIWAAMAQRGVRRGDRATWPVYLEMDDVVAAPFAAAGSAPALVAAYDELIGLAETGLAETGLAIGAGSLGRRPPG